MKSISFRLAAALTCLVLHCIASAAYAIGQARADYRNLSSSQGITQQKNPGVACFNGYIKGSQTQTANTIVLQECAFGQAFSQWYPSDTYAPPIIASVTLALYPTITPATTRAAIEGSGKPFRYKWLLYNGTGSDVTSFDATSVADWFTQADRDSIAAQIAELKVAIAASPLDTSLRNLLLDIYYDLAVAEMQAVKPQLALLARYHLGIEVLPPNKFIIDK